MEKHRIVLVKMGATKKGKAQVELFDDTPGFDYPVLYLNKPGLLLEVGIDPNELGAEAHHCNFWAFYSLSKNLNSKGNPYKNIIRLERIDAPATSTSTDTSAILGELRAIKALLLQAFGQPTEAEANAKIHRVQALAHVGSASDPQATDPYEIRDFPPEPEASPSQPCEACGLVECARPSRCAHTLFHRLAGPAIAAGTLEAEVVNGFARSANGEGWEGALARLREALDAAA